MNFGIAKHMRIALLAMALISASGCSGEADQAAAERNSSGTASAPSGTELRDAIQAQMLPGIEAAYASRKAKARMEGGVVYVRMEGDASPSMAGWSECRVVTQAMGQNQAVVIEYPNGSIDCAELFAANE